MKKLYTLALTAAVALSAAATPQLETRTLTAKSQFKAVPAHTIAGVNKMAKAPAAAPALTDILGNYTLTYVVELEAGATCEYEVTMTSGSTTGTVAIDIPFVNGTNTLTMKLEGTYSDGTITFAGGQTFSGVTITYYHWAADYKSFSTVPTISASWSGTGFVFDGDDCIGLPAGGDSFYFLADEFNLTKIVDDPNANPNEGWTSVGEATFQDGWVLTAFGVDQTLAENHYKVELQQNDADQNVYRLVDPYHGNFPLVARNQSTKVGYIQFDVTDPDHVCFAAVEAGFANSSLRVSKMYCYNALGWAVVYTGKTAAEVVAQVGEEFDYTTFKDGVVTLASYPNVEKGGFTSDACFGVQGEINGGYGWSDNQKLGVNMEAKIWFPTGAGVEDVTVSEAEGAVEYYNLQGVRLERPAAGVVIRVQGGKATKMLVK